jgi:hypothetical protein
MDGIAEEDEKGMPPMVGIPPRPLSWSVESDPLKEEPKKLNWLSPALL